MITHDTMKPPTPVKVAVVLVALYGAVVLAQGAWSALTDQHPNANDVIVSTGSSIVLAWLTWGLFRLKTWAWWSIVVLFGSISVLWLVVLAGIAAALITSPESTIALQGLHGETVTTNQMVVRLSMISLMLVCVSLLFRKASRDAFSTGRKQ